MKTYCFILLLCCSSLIFGQKQLIGRVQTTLEKTPLYLSRVHISYAHQKHTSVSNLTGHFTIDLPTNSDTLIATRVGYETVRIPVHPNDLDSLFITLKTSPLVLPQAQNLNEKGQQIIDLMIQRLDSNYHEYLSKLEGIYRHQVIEDSIYSFFAQCKVDLYPTTQRLVTPIKDRKDLDSFLKVMLRSAQMSEDARDPRISSPVALFDLFFNGVFQNDPLLDFPHMFHFRLGKMIYWNSRKLYQIWFSVKDKYKDQYRSKGYLYIDDQSFAIVHKRVEMMYKPFEVQSRTPINTPFTATFSPYSVVIHTDYEQVGNIWRPKFIQRERKLNINSEQFPAINHRYFFIDDFYTFRQTELQTMPTSFLGDTLNIHQDVRSQLSKFHKNRLGQRELKQFNWFILPDFELDRYSIIY